MQKVLQPDAEMVCGSEARRSLFLGSDDEKSWKKCKSVHWEVLYRNRKCESTHFPLKEKNCLGKMSSNKDISNLHEKF